MLILLALGCSSKRAEHNARGDLLTDGHDPGCLAPDWEKELTVRRACSFAHEAMDDLNMGTHMVAFLTKPPQVGPGTTTLEVNYDTDDAALYVDDGGPLQQYCTDFITGEAPEHHYVAVSGRGVYSLSLSGESERGEPLTSAELELSDVVLKSDTCNVRLKSFRLSGVWGHSIP